MKKLWSIVLVLLTVLGLVSCNKDNNDNKIVLEGKENIEEPVDLYRNEIIAKINNGDSFLIYGYLPTCGTCKAFQRDILVPFMKETKSVVYSSYISDLMGVDERIPHKAPVLIIYRDGEIDEIIAYAKNKEVFTETKEFRKFMDKHFILPSMSELTFEELDTKLTNKESFVVYFGWYMCGDCTYMNDAYLNEFLKDNKKKFYYVETDEYRKDKEEKPEEWKAFADKYEFGDYLGGKIPSLVYYENGKKKDMAVYFNDSFAFNEDESLKVTDSYYKDNPHIGKSFASYFDYQKECAPFYNQKIEAFLKKYL